MRNDVFHAAEALDPGGQPGADVTAAGDRGEVIEAAEESVIGESLNGAEGEGGAADSAAGDAERAERLFLLVQPGEDASLLGGAGEIASGAQGLILGGEYLVEFEGVLRHSITVLLIRSWCQDLSGAYSTRSHRSMCG